MPMDKMKMVIKFFKVGLFQCSLTSLIIEVFLVVFLDFTIGNSNDHSVSDVLQRSNERYH